MEPYSSTNLTNEKYNTLRQSGYENTSRFRFMEPNIRSALKYIIEMCSEDDKSEDSTTLRCLI